ncbi:MAG: ATP-dependent DNA helicase RecG [Bacteriovoracaceae bacterium]|nr:ATP-dependent DNA helicase RecG [Bacteriovoracaceae bacterium]
MNPPLTLNAPIESLFKKPPVFLEKLKSSGITQIADLLWILPLHIYPTPKLAPFSSAKEGQLFQGEGRFISIQAKPLFGRKRAWGLMHNIQCVVQDLHSSAIMPLIFFNAYSNLKKKIESTSLLNFIGTPTLFMGKLQIVNPKWEALPEASPLSTNSEPAILIIEYPTINKVAGTFFKKIVDKIPASFWDDIPDNLPAFLIAKRNLLPLNSSFKILHGLQWTLENEQKARHSLIYREFFLEQIKLLIRKKKEQIKKSESFSISEEGFQEILKNFPFTLTSDQLLSLEDIRKDLMRGTPMMRLMQGDVGSGKTAIALVTIYLILTHKKQCALMCPTESLATQHFKTALDFFKNTSFKCALLAGSMKAGEKKIILEKLQKGEIDLLIGTHALFQKNVIFKDLALTIIDEQHKFGVAQRIKLQNKGQNPHCLIMTATPIPRSLCLTHYGDLDISVIKQMPGGRKGIKSRIVIPENFEKFLSFLKTRITLKEQAYIVVPAIEENENTALADLQNTYNRFQKYFKEFVVSFLHGKMSSEEKADVLEKFSTGYIHILISTSVVEVGINVPNASVMAVMNPERFGLSSLHQLRGRVGRGELSGFFFMLLDQATPLEALKRLQVIEQHTDGFIIAEEDLKIRGEGDLFGLDQSGYKPFRKIANIIKDYAILLQAREDVLKLQEESPETLETYVDQLKEDDLITLTT